MAKQRLWTSFSSGTAVSQRRNSPYVFRSHLRYHQYPTRYPLTPPPQKRDFFSSPACGPEGTPSNSRRQVEPRKHWNSWRGAGSVDRKARCDAREVGTSADRRVPRRRTSMALKRNNQQAFKGSNSYSPESHVRRVFVARCLLLSGLGVSI